MLNTDEDYRLTRTSFNLINSVVLIFSLQYFQVNICFICSKIHSYEDSHESVDYGLP